MKTILLLIVLILAAVGCGPPKAPAMKRVPSYDQIDKHYLKDVFVPNYTGSKLQLSNSVSQLDAHWTEFQDFMRQVEAGKIPVVQGFKLNWESGVRRDGAILWVDYSDRLGVVRVFQKSRDQDQFPLLYAFYFSTNGCLISAITKEDSFSFDEHGKVIEYLHK
jgi:hypothetical protein